MQKSFSIKELAKKGFQLTFKHIGLISLVALVYVVSLYFSVIFTKFFGEYLGHLYDPTLIQMPKLSFLPELIKAKTVSSAELAMIKRPFVYLVPILVSFSFSLLKFILLGGLFLGVMKVVFDLYDRGQSRLVRIFSGFGLIGKYLVSLFVCFLFIFLTIICALIICIPFFFISKDVYFVVTYVALLAMIFFVAIRVLFFYCYIVDKKMGGLESIKESFTATRGHFWHLLGALLFCVLMTLTIIGIPAAYFMLVGIYRKIS